MRVGLLLIGDELLTGKIQDRNGFLVAQACFSQGIHLEEIRVVSDEIDAIASSVVELSERFDIVLTSGGIGPTHDDKTYVAMAQAFDVGMEVHAVTKERLAAYLLAKGKQLNGARLKMVTFPQGAFVEEINDLWLPLVSVKNVFILPGVPELFAMLLKPILAKFAGQPKAFKALGTQIAEGDLAEVLEKAIEKWPDVVIGSYPQARQAGFRVKITVESIHEPSVTAAVAWLVSELSGTEL
jgi:molybdenum cofactor synthesis domain-containing protein